MLIGLSVQAQDINHDYYPPDDVTYDESIHTPESVLGFEPGE
ncbi:MAG: hypothetical protein WD491_08100 [Balneolales bacterium]